MVIPDDGELSRAQIILVGALAMAFIILGIVVVFNTSLYAENVDSTGTVSTVSQAEQVAHAGGRSVAGLAYRVNEGTYTEAGVAGAVEGNATNVSSVWQALSAKDRPTLINVSLDEANSTYGVRVFQSTDADFSDRNRSLENWKLTPTSGTYADVGRFEMRLKRSSLDTGVSASSTFHVAALGSDDSGDWLWRNVWFVENTSANGVDVYVSENSSSSEPTSYDWYDETGSKACTASNTTTPDVDLVDGAINGTDCFDFFEGMGTAPGEDGYEVRFRNGGNATGQYDAHLSTTAFESVGTQFDAGGDAPYYSYVLWETAVVVDYETPDTSYNRTITVPVYNSSR